MQLKNKFQNLEYLPINFSQNKDICLSFRRDAHRVSFGCLDNYDPANTLQWYQKLLTIYPEGFVHVWLDQQIIGQLEFNAKLTAPNGQAGGYVYFIYLIPEYRGCGFGKQLLNYATQHLASKGCKQAALRYIEGNYRAENLYLKNGWIKQGPLKDSAQLMVKDLTGENNEN